MSIKREVEVELAYPIEIADGEGGTVEASAVVLKAPTAKSRKHCAYLKQQFLIALPKGQKKTEGAGDEEDPNHEDVVHLLGSSKDVDLAAVLEISKKLFTEGFAFIEGKRMTSAIYDDLSMDDAERLLGEYMLGFILGSVLEKQKSS